MSIALWPVSIIFVDFLRMCILLNKILISLQVLKLHDRALYGVARGMKFLPSVIRGGGRIFDLNYQVLPPNTSVFNENKHFVSFGGSIPSLQVPIFGLRGPISDARESTEGLWELFGYHYFLIKLPLFEMGPA